MTSVNQRSYEELMFVVVGGGQTRSGVCKQEPDSKCQVTASVCVRRLHSGTVLHSGQSEGPKSDLLYLKSHLFVSKMKSLKHADIL